MSDADAFLKYKFLGIGKVSAKTVMIALTLNPSLKFLSAGPLGKFTEWFLTWLFSGFASCGVVIVNIGIEKASTPYFRKNFDGSMDAAIKAVDAGSLTPQEGKKFDDAVIKAHNDFTVLGRPE